MCSIIYILAACRYNIRVKSLFSILSHNETLEMFAMAKDGLKISPSIIVKLDISPKAYYRALKQLKNAGLVEKRKSWNNNVFSYHFWFYCLSEKYCRNETIY